MEIVELEKQNPQIPEAARALLTSDGYFTRFFELVEQTSTYREAYTELEMEYEEIFGKEKYTSYESFRHMKKRYLKSLSEKKQKA